MLKMMIFLKKENSYNSCEILQVVVMGIVSKTILIAIVYNVRARVISLALIVRSNQQMDVLQIRVQRQTPMSTINVLAIQVVNINVFALLDIME